MDPKNVLYSLISNDSEYYIFTTSRINTGGKEPELYTESSGVNKIQEITKLIKSLNSSLIVSKETKLSSKKTLDGYFTMDGKFLTGQYTTEFYPLEDCNYILKGIDYDKKEIKQIPYLVYAKKNDGNTLYCKMYDQGAMTGDRMNGVKAFQMSYGAGNTKTYHYVYGNGKIGNLKKGDSNYYTGWFCISDKDFAIVD